MHAAPTESCCSHSGIWLAVRGEKSTTTRRRCLMRELLQRGDLVRRRLLTFDAVRIGDPRGERVALLGLDDDEAPRCDLAMIGHARGDLQDRRELRGIGPRRDQIARAARAARGKEREQCGGVVEHGVPVTRTAAYLHTRDCR